MTNKNGQQIAQEYVERLTSYLANIAALPSRSGKLNVSKIADESGVPRQSLYKNEDCRRLLEEAVATKGLVGIQERPEDYAAAAANTEKARLERRITSLEQQNSSLVAENHELRRQLLKFSHIEDLMSEGWRVMQ